MLIFKKEISSGVEYQLAEMGKTEVYIIAAIVLAVVLTFYALRSVGLFTLSRRKSYKFAWLSFVPCAWLYCACRLIGETKLFGVSFKKLALWVTIVFAVGEALSLVYNFIEWYPVVGYFTQGGEVTVLTGVSGGAYVLTGDDFTNPFPPVNLPIFKVINVITYFTSLFTTLVTVFLYINLFRNYWPQHYILASVLSFFGLFGVFVFVIRNKSEMKYSDYLRSRYGNVYGPYSNPYYRNGNGGYNGGGYGGNYERPPETPFKDFAERGDVDPGDPFSEFSDDDKKDDNK